LPRQLRRSKQDSIVIAFAQKKVGVCFGIATPSISNFGLRLSIVPTAALAPLPDTRSTDLGHQEWEKRARVSNDRTKQLLRRRQAPKSSLSALGGHHHVACEQNALQATTLTDPEEIGKRRGLQFIL
jgi:hypothetical protein